MKNLRLLSIGVLAVLSLQAAQSEEAMPQPAVTAAPNVQSLSQDIRQVTDKINILVHGSRASACMPKARTTEHGKEQDTMQTIEHALQQAGVTIVNSNVFITVAPEY